MSDRPCFKKGGFGSSGVRDSDGEGASWWSRDAYRMKYVNPTAQLVSVTLDNT
jgi:hypothetical protein